MGNIGSVSLEAIPTPPTALVCTGKEAVEVQSTAHPPPQQTALTALTANVQTPVQNRIFLSGYFLSLISITESKKKKRDDTELFPTNNSKADWTALLCYCRLFVVRLPKNKPDQSEIQTFYLW